MSILEQYRDKVVLITGGAGAIGSNLVRALVPVVKRVIVVDDLSSGYTWMLPNAPNMLFVRGDILDEGTMRRVFFQNPEIVFHLAAFFANQNSLDYPERDLMVNGLGTLRVLQYASLARAQRVVYASSGCSIYGHVEIDDPRLPFREEHVSLDLSTPYQATKMLGEVYANIFQHNFGVSTARARFFNSYGPGEVPGPYRNVIPNFIWWAKQGQPLPITGTGEETRDFTYVGDVIDGLLRMGVQDAAAGDAFNLATGREVQIGQMATWINELTGNKAGIVYTKPRHWDTKKRIWGDVSRAREKLGYDPHGPEHIREIGLPETVRWFNDNWDHIVRSAEFGPGIIPVLSGSPTGSGNVR